MSPQKNIGPKEILLAQMEEKRKFEQHEKERDQDFLNQIQQRDQNEADKEQRLQMKCKQQKNNYLRALKEQIKVQQKL